MGTSILETHVTFQGPNEYMGGVDSCFWQELTLKIAECRKGIKTEEGVNLGQRNRESHTCTRHCPYWHSKSSWGLSMVRSRSNTMHSRCCWHVSSRVKLSVVPPAPATTS